MTIVNYDTPSFLFLSPPHGLHITVTWAFYHCHLRHQQSASADAWHSVLLDTHLLTDILRNGVLVHNEVHGLVSDEVL